MKQEYEFLPLRDVVFNTLRQEILFGTLKPGENLREVALANRIGVSRTPVREAIRMLEIEGLVVMQPGKGAKVAEITRKELEDVLEVRNALEKLAIELACERMTEEQLAALKKNLLQFKEAVQIKDVTKLAAIDEEFHDIIFNATDNKRLINLLNSFKDQMYRFRFEYLKDSSNYERLVTEHERVITGLEQKDADAAKSSISDHIYGQAVHVGEKIKEVLQ